MSLEKPKLGNSRAYLEDRLVGPYDTFEDYCKDVEGLAYSVALQKIKAYLVHDAIVKNLGSDLSQPSIETQVRQLFIHDTAIAKFSLSHARPRKSVVVPKEQALFVALSHARTRNATRLLPSVQRV